jgi:hypothetical protein
MTMPLASIRRFDIFAEYSRLEKLAEGVPDDEAKGYALWRAKVVAAIKFGRMKPGAHEVAPEEAAERARRKFRSLSGVEQTDRLFDKEIVARMGEEFYEKAFRPAIAAAFKSGKSYREIRDSLRQAWQVKAEKPGRARKPLEPKKPRRPRKPAKRTGR